MLQIKTEFPQVGAECFVRHTAEPVRILRREGETSLVGRTGLRPAQHRATDTFRVDADQLVATEAEARAIPKRSGRRAGR